MKPLSISSYTAEAPALLRDFLTYISTIRGKSDQTAHEYFLDLRMFFRFLKQKRGLVSIDMPLEEIPYQDIEVTFLRDVTLSETYEFLDFIAHERPQHQNSPSSRLGLGAAARARKISSIRAFFRYMTDKVALFEINPVANLESPSQRKTLPRYLTVEDSVELLQHVSGPFATRDFCILTFFLNCGMRVSELVNINIADIDLREGSLRILGKGNKERMLYLNDACVQALNAYLPDRILPCDRDKHALFISKQRNRINVQTVKWLVKKYLSQAGLDSQKFSVHKLRHTAATLMYQSGVDVRTLQTVLGHANLDTTMIYTHVNDESVRAATNQNPLAHLTISPKKEEEAVTSTDVPEEPETAELPDFLPDTTPIKPTK